MIDKDQQIRFWDLSRRAVSPRQMSFLYFVTGNDAHKDKYSDNRGYENMAYKNHREKMAQAYGYIDDYEFHVCSNPQYYNDEKRL